MYKYVYCEIQKEEFSPVIPNVLCAQAAVGDIIRLSLLLALHFSSARIGARQKVESKRIASFCHNNIFYY